MHNRFLAPRLLPQSQGAPIELQYCFVNSTTIRESSQRQPDWHAQPVPPSTRHFASGSNPPGEALRLGPARADRISGIGLE